MRIQNRVIGQMQKHQWLAGADRLVPQSVLRKWPDCMSGAVECGGFAEAGLLWRGFTVTDGPCSPRGIGGTVVNICIVCVFLVFPAYFGNSCGPAELRRTQARAWILNAAESNACAAWLCYLARVCRGQAPISIPALLHYQQNAEHTARANTTEMPVAMLAIR